MLEIFLGLAVGGTVAVLIRQLVALRRDRIAKMHFFRDQFFEYADAVLADDDNVTDEQLRDIKRMAGDIADPTVFGDVLSAARRVEKQWRAGNVANGPSAEPWSDWYRLLLSYFMAISYLRVLQGILLRSLLAGMIHSHAGTRNVEIIDRSIHSGRLHPV